MLDSNSTLYILPQLNGTTAMWVVGSSAPNLLDPMYVSHDGSFGYSTYYATSIGFRSIVCLENEVELQKTEDRFLIK